MPLNEAKYIKKADKGKHIDLFNRKKEPETTTLPIGDPSAYISDADEIIGILNPSGNARPDKTRVADPPISKTNDLLDEYSLWNYLNDYEDFSGKKVSKKERTAIWEMWVESGRPHVYRETREENLAYNLRRLSKEDIDAGYRAWAHMNFGKYHTDDWFEIGDEEKGDYVRLPLDKGRGYFDPDTLFLVDSAKPDWMLEKLVAEMAHSYDEKYTKYGDEGTTPWGQRLLYQEKYDREWKERGRDVYDTPGDMEHQVHGPGGMQESLWERLLEARESPSIKESPFLPGYSRY